MEAVDKKLIAEIISGGSEDARRTLYDGCFNRVYWQCRRYKGITPEDAEDIVQDVFITVFEKLDSLEDQSRFHSWLRTITRNRCLQFLKERLRRNLARKGYEAEYPVTMESPEEYAMLEQEIRIVRDMISTVSDDEQRVTVELFYMRGLSCEDISDKQGITVTSVTTRLSRFRVRVQRRLIRKVLELREET